MKRTLLILALLAMLFAGLDAIRRYSNAEQIRHWSTEAAIDRQIRLVNEAARTGWIDESKEVD